MISAKLKGFILQAIVRKNQLKTPIEEEKYSLSLY